MKRYAKAKRTLFFTALTCFSSSVYATWTGGLEAGTQLGSGESPTLRFFANSQSKPLSHYIYLDWTRESFGNRYRLGYEPTYSISKSFYSFGRFNFEQDDPGEIDRKLNAKVGIGNSFLRTGNSALSLEAGIGAQQLRLSNGTEDTDGFVFTGADFTTKLLDFVRFDVIADTRVGESQATVDAEVGISIRIAPNAALKYAFRYRRFAIDGLDNDIIEEDSFFTVTYGF